MGNLQECGDFTWRVSDCEELVGVTHRRWWGWFFSCGVLLQLFQKLLDWKS